MTLATPLKQTQALIAQHVKQGDTVVDATVGNGKDTLFLAKLVGIQGTVYGFDIQRIALEKAKSYLTEHLDYDIDININHTDDIADTDDIDRSSTPNENACNRIILYKQSHAHMLHCIPKAAHGKVSAIMFNLGYLPGGDHSVITKPDSTLPALDAALQLLKKGGLISIMVYRGHEGGLVEAERVKAWATQLPQQSYQVLKYEFINQINTPPFLIAIKSK